MTSPYITDAASGAHTAATIDRLRADVAKEPQP